MGQRKDGGWSPLGVLIRVLRMLIGIPDRSGWKVPDNSWTDSGRPADALVIEARPAQPDAE